MESFSSFVRPSAVVATENTKSLYEQGVYDVTLNTTCDTSGGRCREDTNRPRQLAIAILSKRIGVQDFKCKRCSLWRTTYVHRHAFLASDTSEWSCWDPVESSLVSYSSGVRPVFFFKVEICVRRDRRSVPSLLPLSSDRYGYEERVLAMRGRSRDTERSCSVRLVFLNTKLEWHKAEIFCLNWGKMLLEAREATLMQARYQAAARDLANIRS